MRASPAYITVKCTNKDCLWEGLEDCSSQMAQKKAAEHIEHTKHAVCIEERRTFFPDDD